MLLWRNWQTQWTQNPSVAIPCRFKSGQQHQLFTFLFCYPNLDENQKMGSVKNERKERNEREEHARRPQEESKEQV